MLKSRSLLAAALILGGLPLFAQTKDDKDVVHTRDGKTVSMSIDAENWDTVSGKGAPPIPWDDVKGIDYKDAAEFSKAIEAFNAGNTGAALKQFLVLKKDAKLRKIFKQTIAFDTAYASEQEGKYDDAIAGYQDVIKTYDKGRYHVKSAERMTACMIAKQDLDGALKTIDSLVSEVGSEPGLAAALGLIKARLLMSQKKVFDAKLLYAAAADAKGVPPWVVYEGQLGQATAVLQEGKEGNAVDAELRFRTLTKVDASPHVLAGAWNGLGDILADRGRAKKDIDQLLDALYCYLRGATVYAPLAGDPTDQYERSLGGAVQCFDYVADLEPNKERKTLYRQRAAERNELLKKEFPFSPFIKNK